MAWLAVDRFHWKLLLVTGLVRTQDGSDSGWPRRQALAQRCVCEQRVYKTDLLTMTATTAILVAGSANGSPFASKKRTGNIQLRIWGH